MPPDRLTLELDHLLAELASLEEALTPWRKRLSAGTVSHLPAILADMRVWLNGLSSGHQDPATDDRRRRELAELKGLLLRITPMLVKELRDLKR